MFQIHSSATSWILVLSLLLLQVLLSSAVDDRRPFWNLYHMANSIPEIEPALDDGANGIEFDVKFSKEGIAERVFHGWPCDCLRFCSRSDEFTTYLDHMRQLTDPGNPKFRKELTLVFLDLKLNRLSEERKTNAGIDVAKKFMNYYWGNNGTFGGQAYVMLSVPSVKHFNFFVAFRETLDQNNFSAQLSKVGYDISGNEGLPKIRAVYESTGIDADHVWQSDGIMNCLPRTTRRLRKALRVRDGPDPFFSKVYWWTVDWKFTMRITMRLGVDSLMTNHPKRLRDVLQESEFASEFRLATLDDNPWQWYNNTPTYMAHEEDIEEVLYQLEPSERVGVTRT